MAWLKGDKKNKNQDDLEVTYCVPTKVPEGIVLKYFRDMMHFGLL